MTTGADSTLWFYYILLSKKKLVTESVPILFRALMAVKPIQSWDYPQQGIYPIFLIQGSQHSRAITAWNTQSVISQQHAESLCVLGRVGEKHTPPSCPLSLHINHLRSGLIHVVYVMNPCRHPPPRASTFQPRFLLQTEKNSINPASSVPGCVVGTGSQGKLVTPLIQGHQRCASPDILVIIKKRLHKREIYYRHTLANKI